MSELRDLYEEVILDHNRNPRNFDRKPECCTHSANGFNPLCGDRVEVHLSVDGESVTDATFSGEGCAITTAAASIMTEAVKGRSVDDVHELFNNIRNALTDDEVEVDEASLGKVAVILGVREFPMRVKCATLPWHTLEAALNGEEKTTTE
ncbi:MAG: Fe-S cluster assembly sulfur transfer protein SufU [Pseudomonadota bacterium]